MALQDIYRALDEQADAEIDSIMRVANAQAAALVREAREQAERLRDAVLADAELHAQAKAERAISSAHLQAKRAVDAVRSSAIERVFEEVGARLPEKAAAEGYPALLESLIREALEGAGSGATVEVRPDDEALARTILATTGFDAAVRPTLEATGGVIVISGDGKVIRRNTLESRLARVRAHALAAVAQVLEQ